MEFNTKFLLFSSLGTSIYRLTVQMSVWLDKNWAPSKRQSWAVRTDNCAINCPRISLKFFPEMSLVQTVVPYHPNGRTSAAK
jgi:hypothetical protein